MHASLNALPSSSFFGSTVFQEREPSGAAHLASSAPAVDSRELLKGQKTVAICHNGLVYRLQATKLGKLILTK
ncbi:hemin uptake protein HemP [Acidovorax sp. SUPP2522]|uniref:hemin uptake protein HemP n=1 Tax=unclassified Acidovorax TaxID=2684926 RepID=UPI00234AEA46|nr:MULTISPECIES: hemin uptake protein HemP [unclassified Acidovorax]WCM95674.1 hemin uptake protein HemP [Acidovorax sp. GBBC 1281]GKT17616.1 hemin uptake protein HemP [Acidovorax sp. SUPP2522]